MFLAGLSMVSLATPIAIFLYLFGSNDDSTGVMFLICCLVAIAGAVLMVFGKMSQRNTAALKSIENNTKTDFCPNCKVNVSAQNGLCPICSTKLEKR